MKTKFYKRLVPLALIASMAMTNVGITSASAQEITASYGQTVEFENVGTGTLTTNGKVEFATSAATSGTITITVSDVDLTQVAANTIKLFDGTGSSKTQVDSSCEKNADSTTLTFTISNEKLASHGSTINGAAVFVTGLSETQIGSTINLERIDADHTTVTTPASTPVAAGDVFQIPGGLVANKSKQETYTVGVKKIVGTDAWNTGTASSATNAAEKIAAFKAVNVKLGDIKEKGTSASNPDNTLGDWDGTYQGATPAQASDPALLLTPTVGDAIIGKYVLYYSYKTTEGSTTTDNPTYVRLLSNDEVAALPLGDWKTADNLTKIEESDTSTTKVEKDEYKYMYTTEGDKYRSLGVKGVFLDLVKKDTSDENKITGWEKASNSIDAKGAGAGCYVSGEIPASGADEEAIAAAAKVFADKHLVDVPNVSTLSGDNLLNKDTGLVAKLIEKYDAKYASSDTDKKFVNQFTRDANSTATPPVTAHSPKNDWSNVALCDESGVPNATGLAKLGELLLEGDNFELLADDSCATATKNFYNELVAFAKANYINECNRTIYQNGPVLTKLQWVLETKKDASEEITTKSGKKTEYTKNSGAAKFWGKKLTKKTDKKTKAVSWTEAAAESSCARVGGASVEVSNTKANGNFNSAVYIKAVDSTYDTPTAKVNKTGAGVVLAEGFYIPPAVPSAFTDKSLSASASKAGIEFASVATHFDAAVATKRIYTLTLDVGKSYKLPFALKDGKDKALVYAEGEGSSGFTVVNGKVTAYAPNGVTTLADTANFDPAVDANYIKVYSRTSPDVYAYVQVKVKAAVKSITANVKKVGMWKGAKQYVSLATNPVLAPDNLQYVVENGDSTTYTVKGVKSVAANGDITYSTDTNGKLEAGVNVLEISTNEGKDPAKASITVNVVEATKTENLTSKALTINLSPVSAPQDIKTAKATVKAKNGSIAIPQGGAASYGFTVTPVGAPTALVDSDGHILAHGDVVQVGGAVKTSGSLSDTFKAGKNAIKSDDKASSYVGVDPYNPASSIVLTDDNYEIKGGFLMTASAAATDCNKEFKAGNSYVMTLPTAGDTTEPITWKSNNPAAVMFEKVTESGVAKLKITPCQTGTFTITGTTPYTKQKLSFKMLVGAENKSEDVTAATDSTDGTVAVKLYNSYGAEEDAEPDGADKGKYVVNAGEKFNAFMLAGTNYANGVGGPVKFALKNAADKSKATVTKNGEIKTKAGGDVTIVATMTKPDKSSLTTKEFTIKVRPAHVYLNGYKAPTGVIKNTDFSLSASLKGFNKNTMELKWTAIKNGTSDEIDLTAMPKDKASGKIKFTDPGTYQIWAIAYEKTDTNKANILYPNSGVAEQITVVVYDKAINGANTNNGDADAKKAISALGGKYDESNDTKKNNGSGYGYVYVPIYLTMKDSTGKSVAYTDGLTMNDIVWTSSNKNLAKVVALNAPTESIDYRKAAEGTDVYVEESDIIKGYTSAAAVAQIKVANATDNHYTGMVTLKGVTKNSKKTITIKINVLDKARTFVAAYDPQTFANDTNLTLANIDDSGVKKALANVGDSATVINKAITDAASGKKKDKTFVMNKWVLVKGTDIKAINKDTENLVAEPWQATVNKDAATNNCKVNFVPASMIDATNGPVSAITAKSITDAANVTAGTWYLAVAEVTYKVKQEKVEADTTATPAVEAKPLLLEETAIKVTKIASKTPIVKATS